jgi:hypothetical protein
MMLRDTAELRQPLAKNAVAVLAGVCVSVADDVGARVGRRPFGRLPPLVLDFIVDRVIIGSEDDTAIAVLSDIPVSVFQVLTDEKPNLSVIPTYKCHHWWIVGIEASAPSLESALV